jgi:hypothetical protein
MCGFPIKYGAWHFGEPICADCADAMEAVEQPEEDNNVPSGMRVGPGGLWPVKREHADMVGNVDGEPPHTQYQAAKYVKPRYYTKFHTSHSPGLHEVIPSGFHELRCAVARVRREVPESLRKHMPNYAKYPIAFMHWYATLNWNTIQVHKMAARLSPKIVLPRRTEKERDKAYSILKKRRIMESMEG